MSLASNSAFVRWLARIFPTIAAAVLLGGCANMPLNQPTALTHPVVHSPP
jgi:hypothetical protein